MVHIKTRPRISNSCEFISNVPSRRAAKLAIPVVFLLLCACLRSRNELLSDSNLGLIESALLQLGSIPTTIDSTMEDDATDDNDTGNDVTSPSLHAHQRSEKEGNGDVSEPIKESDLFNDGASILVARNYGTEVNILSKDEAVPLEANDMNRILSLEDERATSLDYVKSFRKIGRPLKFFHIPKTAGTAIEYAAGKTHISWGSCLFNHKPKRSICRYPDGPEWPQYMGWWHLPAQLFPIGENDPYQDAELFGVIRDPYDRMVSEFYYICTLKVFDWRPDQCDRSKLTDANYMNQWITRKINDRKRDTGLSYLVDNGHFSSQYDFIVGPHQVRMLDYVLKMNEESLADDFHRLMKAFGLSQVQLEKLNALGASARGDSSTHLTVEDLDAATLGRIDEQYPSDFALGAYQRRSTAKT